MAESGILRPTPATDNTLFVCGWRGDESGIGKTKGYQCTDPHTVVILTATGLLARREWWSVFVVVCFHFHVVSGDEVQESKDFGVPVLSGATTSKKVISTKTQLGVEVGSVGVEEEVVEARGDGSLMRGLKTLEERWSQQFTACGSSGNSEAGVHRHEEMNGSKACMER